MTVTGRTSVRPTGTVDNCTECRGDASVALVNYGTPVNGNTPGTGTNDAMPGTGTEMNDGTRAHIGAPHGDRR